MGQVPDVIPGADRPLEVMVALRLRAKVLQTISDRLGSAFRVRDMRRDGRTPDLVLVPPASPQLVSRMKRQYPSSSVVVVELEDWLNGVDTRGPVRRLLNAGADAYVVATSPEDLADVLRSVRPAVPATTPRDAAIVVAEVSSLPQGSHSEVLDLSSVAVREARASEEPEAR